MRLTRTTLTEVVVTRVNRKIIFRIVINCRQYMIELFKNCNVCGNSLSNIMRSIFYILKILGLAIAIILRAINGYMV